MGEVQRRGYVLVRWESFYPIADMHGVPFLSEFFSRGRLVFDLLTQNLTKLSMFSVNVQTSSARSIIIDYHTVEIGQISNALVVHGNLRSIYYYCNINMKLLRFTPTLQ